MLFIGITDHVAIGIKMHHQRPSGHIRGACWLEIALCHCGISTKDHAGSIRIDNLEARRDVCDHTLAGPAQGQHLERLWVINNLDILFRELRSVPPQTSLLPQKNQPRTHIAESREEIPCWFGSGDCCSEVLIHYNRGYRKPPSDPYPPPRIPRKLVVSQIDRRPKTPTLRQFRQRKAEIGRTGVIVQRKTPFFAGDRAPRTRQLNDIRRRLILGRRGFRSDRKKEDY